MPEQISPQRSVAAYFELNDAVCDVFFDGRYQQRPVYLEIADDRVEELSDKLGIGQEELDDFVGLAVAETFVHGEGDPYAWHLQETRRWSASRKAGEKPPFLGVLALLSLAAERMRDDGEFSSHNYYTRLVGLLQAEGTTLSSRVRNYARSTRALWRSLNQWLTENDFELGRPTAMQVNSWAYVSYALSQALVRDADRQRFHSLFREFNLSALDDVSASEMLLFLHEWMAGVGPNAWLKKLWSTADLRERIANSALVELKHWDVHDEKRGPRARQLAWSASLGGFPRRRLGLFLTTIGLLSEDDVPVTAGNKAGEALEAALEGCEGQAYLAPSPTGDFSVLEPISGMNLSALLLASVQLEGAEGEKFCHTPRPIVPLAEPDGGAYYREVQRASLLRRHVVLCHEQWLAKVAGHLAQCARPGYKVLTSEDLPGLPSDWRLIENVELVRVLEDANENLAALVPLSEGIAVQLDGGFRLSPNIWHRQSPPGILATSDRGDFDLVVRRQAIDSKDTVLFERSSKGGSCIVAPSDFESHGATEVSIVAKLGTKEAGEKNVAFRDASIPRPLRSYDTAYDLAGPCIGGSDKASIDGSSWIEGMVINGPAPVVQVNELSNLKPVISRELGGDVPRYAGGSVSGLQENCVIRGYHVWRCETARWNEPSWEAKRMDCKDCGMSVVLRNRGKKKKAPTLARAGTKSQPVAAPPVEPESLDMSPVLLLDGLSYLGEGTWHAFQSIAAASSKDPWAPATLARDLRDLGHLDYRCDKAGRPSHWRISPPALVFGSEDKCYLAGFRSGPLIDQVADALEDIGGEYSAEGTRFSRVAWSGISFKAAQGALEGVADPHGRQLKVVASPALAIAGAAWPTSRLFASSSPIHVESLSDLQVFSPSDSTLR